MQTITTIGLDIAKSVFPHSAIGEKTPITVLQK
jgi:hypothetical protein